jgi:hypothetical protein
MADNARIAYLRGGATGTLEAPHPILELTDEELRLVIGGVDIAMASSNKTGSYNASNFACCDGTKVCCGCE